MAMAVAMVVVAVAVVAGSQCCRWCLVCLCLKQATLAGLLRIVGEAAQPATPRSRAMAIGLASPVGRTATPHWLGSERPALWRPGGPLTHRPAPSDSESRLRPADLRAPQSKSGQSDSTSENKKERKGKNRSAGCPLVSKAMGSLCNYSSQNAGAEPTVAMHLVSIIPTVWRQVLV